MRLKWHVSKECLPTSETSISLSIPIEQVEKVKDWLDRSNIIFYDLQINVKWVKFMQNIRSNFKDFVADGGWSAWDSDEEEKIQQGEE